MANPYPQLVLLGDSLIEQSVEVSDGFSFFAALQHHCNRRLDVVNRGFSGYTTKNVIKFLEDIFPQPTASSPKIEYLFILLGANDAVLPILQAPQHVPIDEYKANLGKIISHPHVTAHKPKIFIVTPPPVDEIKTKELNMAEGFPCSRRSSACSASYSEKAREVARENPGVVLIDLWQALMDEAISLTPDSYQSGGPLLGTPENGKRGGLEKLLHDGLHMTGDAYRIFFEIIQPHVGSEWPKTEGDRTGYVFPDWKVLNPETL
ncbi:hypothetical protein S40285_01196 [Stachybotrys chlorohalonatus IBT 40285]|uniref:SGNH hydrolase-type esterase domain-containing protein n=1 Tax=Stachybotrys chlorohalonatus (strain IBT 40285) TaxID=1283841 RepID=A0A084QXV1_STAC4|nr:hypothetical protein S40285_01196 [Stachybotrys chlorohalonata IBT 40285]